MKKAQFGGELGQKLKSEISKSLKKKNPKSKFIFLKKQDLFNFYCF